ncbi:hypothetical protein LINPERPRIM_LOCUS40849 [Linum perenne]
MLTGVIFVFLSRSIRRRIKRAKWSTGATKMLKDEALEILKAFRTAVPVEDKKPMSLVQALIGGISE